MIIRFAKTIVVAGAAYYATRAAKAHAKLMQVRAEAKEQIDELEATLKDVFARRGKYENMSADEAGKLFDLYFVQHKRVTKIYNKTF